jgi:hypothetical protein
VLSSNPSAPVIAAWEVYIWLKDIIEPCWNSISGRVIVGYKKKGSNSLFYHPLPRKKYYKSKLSPLEQWISEVTKSADPIILPDTYIE